MSNYIRYRPPGPGPDAEGNNNGRINYIFVHEQKKYDKRCIFLMLIKVKPIDYIHLALELLVVEDIGESLIIGVPALLIHSIYIVDISRVYERG